MFIEKVTAAETSIAAEALEQMLPDSTESGPKSLSPQTTVVISSPTPQQQKDAEEKTNPIQAIPAPPPRVPLPCWRLLLAKELTEAERRRKQQLITSLKIAADAQVGLQTGISKVVGIEIN